MFRHASRLAVLALLPSGTECIIQAAILLFLALGCPRRQRTPLEGFLESEDIGQARTQALVHVGQPQRVSVSTVQPRTAAKPKESTPVMSGSVLSLVCRPGQGWSRDGELGPGPHLFGPTSVPVAGGIGPTGHGVLAPDLVAYAASDTEYYDIGE
ncbi:hypothetical protein B0T21DRAFT_343363 [Apiosordaria backusii]|uniref:Uncharacterized protein n=1 Tax=Apiosordaria backusii TaxID=314023 RepID=A0AA40K6W3_9PEZI|nr:hypothetical protein B0T21DRAFT_343363 [Apiosordaria backusii]